MVCFFIVDQQNRFQKTKPIISNLSLISIIAPLSSVLICKVRRGSLTVEIIVCMDMRIRFNHFSCFIKCGFSTKAQKMTRIPLSGQLPITDNFDYLDIYHLHDSFFENLKKLRGLLLNLLTTTADCAT